MSKTTVPSFNRTRVAPNKSSLTVHSIGQLHDQMKEMMKFDRFVNVLGDQYSILKQKQLHNANQAMINCSLSSYNKSTIPKQKTDKQTKKVNSIKQRRPVKDSSFIESRPKSSNGYSSRQQKEIAVLWKVPVALTNARVPQPASLSVLPIPWEVNEEVLVQSRQRLREQAEKFDFKVFEGLKESQNG